MTEVVSCPLHLQSFVEVLPSRVHLFNEFYLSGPVPCFQLPFPLSGVYNAVELLEPNELVSIVPCREGIGIFFCFVTFHTTLQITGDAGIQNLIVLVCGDVSPGFHDEDCAKIDGAAASLVPRSSQTRAINFVLCRDVCIPNHVWCRIPRGNAVTAVVSSSFCGVYFGCSSFYWHCAKSCGAASSPSSDLHQRFAG